MSFTILYLIEFHKMNIFCFLFNTIFNTSLLVINLFTTELFNFTFEYTYEIYYIRALPLRNAFQVKTTNYFHLGSCYRPAYPCHHLRLPVRKVAVWQVVMGYYYLVQVARVVHRWWMISLDWWSTMESQ